MISSTDSDQSWRDIVHAANCIADYHLNPLDHLAIDTVLAVNDYKVSYESGHSDASTLAAMRMVAYAVDSDAVIRYLLMAKNNKANTESIPSKRKGGKKKGYRDAIKTYLLRVYAHQDVDPFLSVDDYLDLAKSYFEKDNGAAGSVFIKSTPIIVREIEGNPYLLTIRIIEGGKQGIKHYSHDQLRRVCRAVRQDKIDQLSAPKP
ncbi:MAG: hypothetical protein RPU91_13855 [Candidatus Sedimenticola sp. (ex Thyasira tokunagai)]